MDQHLSVCKIWKVNFIWQKSFKKILFGNISHLLCSAWECILSPPKIFSFQTVFLYTLKDDCNKNWIFCFPSQFWPHKINISQIFFIIVHKIVRSWSFKSRVRPKCWYLPLIIAPETVDDSKPILTPLN